VIRALGYEVPEEGEPVSSLERKTVLERLAAGEISSKQPSSCSGANRRSLMFEKRIPIDEGARLFLLDMAGDLVLIGWEEDDILVRLPGGEEGDLMAEPTEKGRRPFSARARCEGHGPGGGRRGGDPPGGGQPRGPRAPRRPGCGTGPRQPDAVRRTRAVVAEVYGNARVEEAASLRLVGTIYGDGELKAVEAADLQNVRGNLRARGSGGCGRRASAATCAAKRSAARWTWTRWAATRCSRGWPAP